MIAVLLNPNFPSIETQTRELQSAAHALGQPIQIFTALSERELDAAFESMRQLRVGALLVGADVFFASRRTQIVTLAARHSVPAVYEQRAFAEVGGLMSYGTNIAEGYRQAGRYTGRILKVKNRRTFRLCSYLSSNWSSTSRRPRRSASPYHLACLPSPTR